MVTNQQVRLLMKKLNQGSTMQTSAAVAGMDVETARKYRRLGKNPEQVKPEQTWKTRTDPFEAVWKELKEMLIVNPGLQAKKLFQYLQKKNPGKYPDGQLRTLQRKIKEWRVTEGPAREVYFEQVHKPGELAESDFTDMNDLNITIQGQPFEHKLYHLVLTYSNWEYASICFSESYESLSEGFQNALWHLGGVPKKHRTDRLSAAVNNLTNPAEFTERYTALLKHYGIEGQKIRAGKANENGDVEQGHWRLKSAFDQNLMLRGSRDFESREQYEGILNETLQELNSNRGDRFREDTNKLRQLPPARLDDVKTEKATVRPGSTIRVGHNTYSVDSRMIGERLSVKIHADVLEVLHGNKLVDTLPRLRGRGKTAINYRHIIDSLVRKPGAFENYRHKEELFPTTNFRTAYDSLKGVDPNGVSREYVRILWLAARESEEGVDNALRTILDRGEVPTVATVTAILSENDFVPSPLNVKVGEIDLKVYDALLREEGAA